MNHILLSALDAVAAEHDLVSALWASLDVVELARSLRPRQEAEPLVRAIVLREAYGEDFLFQVAALGVIGCVGGPDACAELLTAIRSGNPHLRPYAALAMAGCVSAEAVPTLGVLLQSDDAFTRMAAQEALFSVSRRGPVTMAAHTQLFSLLRRDTSPTTRIAALECLPSGAETEAGRQLLQAIAASSGEPTPVRAAARRALARLYGAGRAPAPPGRNDARRGPSATGPRIAQLVSGSTAGLTTLTTDLAGAFARRDDVAGVLNVTVTGAEHVPAEVPAVDRIVLDLDGPPRWDHRLRIEREMEEIFRAYRPDLIHLRFADVGTIAAARSAARHDVAVYFTFAPDPIVPMQIAAKGGELTRASLAEYDARRQVMFRTFILHQMTRVAAGIALLPRSDDVADRLVSKVFVGPARRIAEGISLHPSQIPGDPEKRAAHTVLELAQAPRSGIGLAPWRRGRPLLLTVARLDRAKGLGTLARVWAEDAHLSRSTNLVIIGGNTLSPDKGEREVLGEIDGVIEKHPHLEGGLLLTGQIPHEEIHSLLAALREGIDGIAAARPIYVCSSPKEEFGVAILEALEAGLPVVGPRVGGPATYLEDGVLGFLADTSEPTALAQALHRALRLRENPDAYERMSSLGRRMVRHRFSVDRMAHQLMSLYQTGEAGRLSSAS